MNLTNIYLYLQIDFVGFVIIGVIYWFGRKHSEKSPTQTIFNILLATTVVMLVSDTLQWVIEGRGFIGARMILETATALFYISTVFSYSLWLYYCDRKINSDSKRTFRQKFYFVPWGISTVITIANHWTGWIYTYDSLNVYHRERFYIIYLGTLFIYGIWSVGFILKSAGKKDGIQRMDAYSLLIFCASPIVGTVIQSMLYGVSMIPICYAIALLIIFIQQQSALVTVDKLTGLNNSRTFIRYLEQNMRETEKRQLFFVIIGDADRFKQINDTHGHEVGNEALIKMAEALKKACGQGDCLSRFGGDEFVIAGFRNSIEDIEEILDKIEENLAEENRRGNAYILSMSLGYTIYDQQVHATTSQLMDAADQMMYQKKREFHERY